MSEEDKEMQIDPEENNNKDAQQQQGDEEEEEIPNELLNEKLETIMSRLAELNIEKEIGEKEKNSDTRIIIESIELDNFKSYADKKRIGPLHYRFNAVVGPNGSGKSNLMESLLFVFGKRAKKMRLNKLSELIHSSTARTNCRTGRVTIRFREIKEDSENTFHYLPEGDFALSREVFKNSSSRYTLNGKEILFDELTNILNKKGIDLKHNRFLILQGEVEQISMMKQKATNPNETGLLEFLEDIIGTNRYVRLIEKLGKSIEELSEIKTSKANRVKISKNELDQLEDVKNASTEYYHNEKELLVIKHLDLSIKKSNNNDAIEKKKIESKDANDALNEGNNQIKIKIDENINILKEHKKIRNEQDALKAKKEELSKVAEEYDEEDRVKRNDIENHMKNIKKTDQQLEKLNKNYQTQNENISNAKESNPKLMKELENMKQLYTELDEEISKKEKEIFNKTDAIQKKKKEYEAKLQPIESEISSNKFQIEQNSSTISLIGEKVTKMSNDIVQLESKEKNLITLLNEKKSALKQVDTIRIELESSKLQQETNSEAKIKQVDAKYKELQTLLTKLSDIKSSFNEKNTKGRILQGLLKAQNEGKLSGILGRLGDLGSIDEKYDCAITTSCGYLDSIVVETVSEATKALNYLKKNRLGKATFLILEKIKWVEKNMKSHFQMPLDCQRIYDLVKYNNPKLQLAFYFALRDTLVTNDIAIAMKVAYGQTRHRVVTLTGEVIEVYGTMRGGGRPRVGGMGSSVKSYQSNSEEEYNQINKEYEKVSKEYEIMKLEINGIENAMTKTDGTLQEIFISKGKLENEINSIEKSMKDITQSLTNIKGELGKHHKEKNKIDELTKENAKMTKANESLANSTTELRKELDEINNQITRVLGDDYNQKKEDWKILKKKIAQMEKEINHNDNILKNANETLEKIKAEIGFKEKAKSDYIASIEKCKKDLTDLETKALNLFGEMEKCDKGIKELEEHFNTKNKEADSLRNIIKKMKDDLDKYKTDITEINDEIKKINKNQVALTEEIKKNKGSFDKLVNEFGFIEQFDEEINKIKKAKIDKEVQDNNNNNNNNDNVEMKNEEGDQGNNDGNNNEEIEIKPILKRHKPGRSMNYIRYNKDNKLQESFTPEEINELIKMNKEISYEFTMLQTKVNDMKPNMSAILQYKETLIQLKEKEDDLNKTITKLKQANDIFFDVKTRRYNEFMDGFNIISSKLKEMYQLITNGGDAELELVDTLDPFSEGISFSVRPPKKSWKIISNLSGGEKTLSSLSLIFALHHYKPSPLYVLDEIDAALDFRNVSIIANYIKEQTKNSQFIIISLRNHMFELANKLVGIYKTMDITKCITFNPESCNLIEEEDEKAIDVEKENNNNNNKAS